MKKYIFITSGLLVVSSLTSSIAAMSAQQVKSGYDSAIASAFINDGGVGQARKLNPNGVNACYKAAADIKSFVDSHSKNLVGIKDSLLNKSAAQLEKITMDAINNMKIIRNMPLAKIDPQLNMFKQLMSDCATTRVALEKESFNVSAKKEAKDVLIFALNALTNFMRGDLVAMELAQELA